MHLKHSVQRLAIVLAVVGALPIAASAARGPSTDQERQQAAALVQLIESAPLTPEADQARFNVLAWLTEIPDITVVGCLQLLGTEDETAGLPAALTMHHAFAAARYAIEHPGAPGDSDQAMVAGVLGTLRAYASLRTAQTVAPNQLLDRLAGLGDSEALHSYVKDRMRLCR